MCGQVFAYRKSKNYCSATCRKAEHQRKKRQHTPLNATNCREVRREQAELFDLAMRLAETLYSMPPGERYGYVEQLIRAARSGEYPRLRKVLTIPKLVRPTPQERHLFWRRSPAYCTIAQAADIYCRVSPWGASVNQVVSGKVPEPPTGEVLELDTYAV
jgi:hypothetical protein